MRARFLPLMLAFLQAVPPLWAEELRGRVLDHGDVREATIQPNMEKTNDGTGSTPVPEGIGAVERCAAGDAYPYTISEDGVPIDKGEPCLGQNTQRHVDRLLDENGVQMTFDALEQERFLNVTAWPAIAARDRQAYFFLYSNYTRFIRRAEVRIFRAGDSTKTRPLAVTDMDARGTAAIRPSKNWGNQVVYVLRVYGGGRTYDETEPKILSVADTPAQDVSHQNPERESLSGYGKNHLYVKNLRISGGAVTVSGRLRDAATRVTVLEREVPVDSQGRFVVREILPAGSHVIPVRLQPRRGSAVELERSLYIPDRDFFYVAMADLVVGQNHSAGPAALVRADPHHYEDKIYVDGRTAFYLKGKIKGDMLLTASADTGEGRLSDVISNFSDKDPRYLLRRLDPDRYYPVYGDDSTTVEDAPTQGKFYVRLEKGDSHVMWGSFQARLTGTEFAQVDRGLYGAKLRLVGGGVTRYGEKRTQIDGFAAEPGSIGARQEFRGTGGSLYYLRNQNIVNGSERVRVEVRDKDSGIVLKVTNLVPSQDYDVNAIQGRIVLREPLPSTDEDGRIVQNATLAGNPVYLVVNYEYTPGLSRLDDVVLGGRASQWIGNHLQLGVTGGRQTQYDRRSQNLAGADATLRLTPNTYIKGEVARTEGPGAGEMQSQDGGFAFSSVPQNTAAHSAMGRRVEGAVAMADIWGGGWSPTGRFYWQTRESGFSSPGQLTQRGNEQWGGQGELPLWTGSRLSLKYDRLDEELGSLNRTTEGAFHQDFGRHWNAALSARREERLNRAFAPTSSSSYGDRTDGAVRVGYDSRARWSAYALGQGTMEKDRQRLNNTRYGAGGRFQATNRLALGAEATDGSGQFGSKVTTDLRMSDRTSFYTSYVFESDRRGEAGRRDTGNFITGARSRYTDNVSVYGEERWLHGTGQSGLTHAYGTELSPDDRWTFGLSGEVGRLSSSAGETRRKTGTFSTAYREGRMKYAGALEGRQDKMTASRRSTWLVKNDLGLQLTPSWRSITKLNLSRSRSSQGAFYDGDYTEAVMGFGYRPVLNDRWNSLFKYQYYDNLASPGQVSAAGTVPPDFTQRSHVLSADATYDLNRRWTVGGKYGLRRSELRASRTSGPFIASTAHLAIVRADWHVLRHVDFLVEGRTLEATEARDRLSGALTGVYFRVAEGLRLGAGYNFSDFSDDLTDLSYRSRGWFLNLTGSL